MLETGRRVHHILASIIIATIIAAGVPAESQGRKAKRKAKKAEQILASNYVPGSGWETYIKDDEGRTKPLLQPVEQNSDKDWMGLQFTDFRGPKMRLAVMKVINRAPAGRWNGIELPLESLEELLSTAIYNTNRFDIVMRKRLEEVFGEQNLGASGRISQASAAEIGQALGAQYLIMASIIEWTPGKSKANAKVSGKKSRGYLPGPLKAGLRGGASTAEVAMSFEVIDATTGELRLATTERATIKNWSLGLDGLVGGFCSVLSGSGLAGYEKNAPINYAVAACVNKAAYKLAMWLKDKPWRGSVVSVENDEVYINAGTGRGLESGMTLTAMAKGKELIDPDTGLKLGAVNKAIGTLQIVSVEERISMTTVTEGCVGLKAGDRVEIRKN